MTTCIPPKSPKLRWLLGCAALLGLAASLPAQTLPFLLEKTEPAPSMRLLWQTEPGVRYDLWKSDDLATWTQVPGYPAAADGLAQPARLHGIFVGENALLAARGPRLAGARPFRSRGRKGGARKSRDAAAGEQGQIWVRREWHYRHLSLFPISNCPRALIRPALARQRDDAPAAETARFGGLISQRLNEEIRAPAVYELPDAKQLPSSDDSNVRL